VTPRDAGTLAVRLEAGVIEPAEPSVLTARTAPQVQRFATFARKQPHAVEIRPIRAPGRVFFSLGRDGWEER
jgi:hypothetical protein